MFYLAPLGITAAAASAINAVIQKKIHASGNTTLIISNEEMNDIMKIIQALENSNILKRGVTKTIKYEPEGGFLSMLLGTLGASLLGSLLTGKGIARAGTGNKKGKGIVRDGTGKEWVFNTTSSFNKIWNTERNIIKMNQNLVVFFQEIIYLKKIKNEAYIINLDEYADGGTHWIALFC